MLYPVHLHRRTLPGAPTPARAWWRSRLTGPLDDLSARLDRRMQDLDGADPDA